jgi:hypothetical protein
MMMMMMMMKIVTKTVMQMEQCNGDEEKPLDPNTGVLPS